MSYKFRPLLRQTSNAGLAQLTGNAGYGFASAGKSLVNLGTEFESQDAKATAIRKAEEEAQKKRNAAASYNTMINPTAAKGFKPEELGRVNLSAPVVKDGFTLKDGEARYDANGKQLVALPKAAKNDAFKTVVDKEDFIHIVMDDGTTTKTKIKSKDWNASRGGGTKDGGRAGYVFAGNFNISDELDYELATSNSYYTDKNGVRYVNVKKLNALQKLGGTEVK